VNLPQSNPNLARLVAAAEKLKPLLGEIAFVGGCVTGLLLTDPAASPVRPTLDVDAIVAASSYADFTLLEGRLRELGFHQPHSEGTPICRWMCGDLILDLMPTDISVLGFTNRWYRPALENAQIRAIGQLEVRVITAPYFLATKLEAFRGRGKNDFLMSHDLEDLVTVVDGRAELVDEVRISPVDLRKYLSDAFRELLSNRDFVEALPGHLLPDLASQQRVGLVVERMKGLILEG
jgi:predicted nucleotidyltransferase